MDVLVAAHQKYGGTIADDQVQLAKMAPAMKAMNLGVNDGVTLLNLFKDAGLKASVAQAGLNGAITKLPRGTTLMEFMHRLETTHSASKRAQMAIDVFGAKAGPALANALSHGSHSLEHHRLKLHQVKGTAEKAGAALDSSFGEQTQLALKNIGGALADVGTKFGPLLFAVAALGPLIGPVLAGVGAIAGALFGEAFDGGVGAGLLLGIPLLIAAAAAALYVLWKDPKLAEQAEHAGGDLMVKLALGFAQLPALLIVGPVAAIAGMVDMITGKTGFLNDIVTGFVSLPGKIAGWVGGIVEQGQTLLSDLVSGRDPVMKRIVDGVVNFFVGLPGQIVHVGSDIGKGIVHGIMDWVGGLAGKLATAIRGAINGIIDLWNGLDFHIPALSFPNPMYGLVINPPGFGPTIDVWSGGDIRPIQIPRLAMGMPYVPFDGFVASLHRGEMVVPAAQAEQMRSGTQTIRHEVDLTPRAAQALRGAGYDERGVAQQLAGYMQGAFRTSGALYSTPRR